MEHYKISAVSYLNTKPLLFGLLQHPISEKLDLQLDIPARCAEKLQSGEVDLALVPVAIIPELSSPYIVSDYCIGTIGPVKTVALYSERPIEELEEIILDHHSRTSVELIQILCREYWKVKPRFRKGQEGYIQEIKGKTGGLIIGDRTIGLEQQFSYVYDLGTAWKAFTGLPFVFAAWVSNRNLDPEFLQSFNTALKLGLDQLPKLKLLLQSPHPDFDIHTYFTRYISYELDLDKRKALKKFLAYLSPELQPTLSKSLEPVL